MSLQPIKDTVDIINGIVTLVVVILGAWTAYGALLLASKPKIIIESVIVYPPALSGMDKLVIAVQFLLFNPSTGSQVVTEVHVQQMQMIQLSAKSPPMSLFPYAFLRAINLIDVSIGKPAHEEFVYPLVVLGQNQIRKHVAFILNAPHDFSLSQGQLILGLVIGYVTHSPWLRPFRPSQTRRLTGAVVVNITDTNSIASFPQGGAGIKMETDPDKVNIKSTRMALDQLLFSYKTTPGANPTTIREVESIIESLERDYKKGFRLGP